MKLLTLLCCLTLITSGCATMAQKRCDAVQEELSEAPDYCNGCKNRLLPEDQQYCAAVCSHTATVAAVAVQACMPTMPAAAPAESTTEDTTADSSMP